MPVKKSMGYDTGYSCGNDMGYSTGCDIGDPTGYDLGYDMICNGNCLVLRTVLPTPFKSCWRSTTSASLQMMTRRPESSGPDSLNTSNKFWFLSCHQSKEKWLQNLLWAVTIERILPKIDHFVMSSFFPLNGQFEVKILLKNALLNIWTFIHIYSFIKIAKKNYLENEWLTL